MKYDRETDRDPFLLFMALLQDSRDPLTITITPESQYAVAMIH